MNRCVAVRLKNRGRQGNPMIVLADASALETIGFILIVIVGILLYYSVRRNNPVATRWCTHCGYSKNRAGYPICQRCGRDRRLHAGSPPVVEHRIVPPPAPGPKPVDHLRSTRRSLDDPEGWERAWMERARSAHWTNAISDEQFEEAVEGIFRGEAPQYLSRKEE